MPPNVILQEPVSKKRKMSSNDVTPMRPIGKKPISSGISPVNSSLNASFTKQTFVLIVLKYTSIVDGLCVSF